VRDTVFSNRLSPTDVDRYLSLMVTEGRLVLLECHVPLPVAPAFVLGVPTLVVEGGNDRLVPQDAALRTSLYHRADHRIVEGAGHLIHLEPGAEDVARDVVSWLEERGL
jgi:pimeloyl-ACP methyl ester carboxylesterase